MANSWLRLWHDMPNDPKWRTIARQSGEPISLVIAVYVHLLVDASRNVTRGHASVTVEDLASALDVTDDEIRAVLSAMDGRVIDGDWLLGWDKRQPKREDIGDSESGAKSAAERKRAQREREKEGKETEQVTDCHDESRNVTLDKDKDKEIKTLSGNPDPVPEKPKKPNRTSEAGEVLAYLNQVCGSRYKPVPANMNLITARLKEGATVDDMKAVVKRQHLAWCNDDAMRQYLRPATLFNATKFANYLGAAEQQTPAAAIPFDRAAYDAKRKAELATAREAYRIEQAAITVPVRAAQ